MNAKARELATNWTENWYGFWAQEAEATGQPFVLDDHIDEAQPTDKEQLVVYLESAPVVAALQTPPVQCGLCNAMVPNSSYRSDGEWLWPDQLGHLVTAHNFLLPDRLVKHIRSKSYRAPSSLTADLAALPWPKRSS